MNRLTESRRTFIEAQPMFFVATAAATGTVNVSPKGMDTLRVLGERRIIWLNLTGSGNETATHVAESGRMTMMWMSLDENPLIVRAYGTASVVHPRDEEWAEMIAHFPTLGGSRQLFDLAIDKITSSCGSGVPIVGEVVNRGETALEPHYAAMSDEELNDYWTRKNTVSIDGTPTRIFSEG